MTVVSLDGEVWVTGPRIAVIGGGAAGLMAAATIAEERPGARVTLFERNPRLGAKVIISGGGRCNVTTGIHQIPEVLQRYPRGARWLRHGMHSFPPRAVMDWFEARGVPLKTEPDLRVFPVSDNGRDVVGAFTRVFERTGVEVRTRAAVTAIQRAEDSFALDITGGDTGRCDRVVLTTGGTAYRHTGSTGEGHRFAAGLGHTVTPLYPSLNAYVVREEWAHALSGLTFPDATLQVTAPGSRERYRFQGAFLFTHFGVSGPAVFAVCALAAKEPYGEHRPLALTINLLPDLNADGVDALLQERCAALGARHTVNVLDTLLPQSICPVLCELAGVEPTLQAARLSRAGRRELAGLIAALPLTVVGRRNGEEFVTAGGVALDEIDPRTMASKLVPGLYFAGEILDVDGFTGGFNLQAAWATGRLAGLAAGSP
jgi:predicted Rossmann fold flavoprotein